MSETNWNARDEESHALAIAPLMREIADAVKAKLPEGTDFGVLIFAPASDPRAEGRVLAITTDRTRVAQYAVQWAATVIPTKRGNR
jgi:hypothetical protein